MESQIINLINGERTSRGLSPLSSSGLLTNSGLGHSRDMACNNFVSHTSPSAGDFITRINAAGYYGSSYGENISAGYGSASAVVSGWMNSSAHRDIILNPSFVHIGVGHANLVGSQYTNYVTADFSRP